MLTTMLMTTLLLASVNGQVPIPVHDTKYDHNELLRRLRFTDTDQLILDELYQHINDEAVHQYLLDINIAVQHIYAITTGLHETTPSSQNYQQILTQIVQPGSTRGLCFIRKDAIIDFMPILLRHTVTAQSIIACEDIATPTDSGDAGASRHQWALYAKYQRNEIRRQLHIIHKNMNEIHRIQNKCR